MYVHSRICVAYLQLSISIWHNCRSIGKYCKFIGHDAVIVKLKHIEFKIRLTIASRNKTFCDFTSTGIYSQSICAWVRPTCVYLYVRQMCMYTLICSRPRYLRVMLRLTCKNQSVLIDMPYNVNTCLFSSLMRRTKRYVDVSYSHDSYVQMTVMDDSRFLKRGRIYSRKRARAASSIFFLYPRQRAARFGSSDSEVEDVI